MKQHHASTHGWHQQRQAFWRQKVRVCGDAAALVVCTINQQVRQLQLQRWQRQGAQQQQCQEMCASLACNCSVGPLCSIAEDRLAWDQQLLSP